ncbi:MAG: PASTA domain-containing protein, partial [Methanosarcinales archaeon]|nr:PASTA domain-containing protein [Methanosarcinales archaeon]
MTFITNLRQNLENLRTAKEIDEASLIEVRNTIDNVEIELQNKDTLINELRNNTNTIISEKIVLEQENIVRSNQIAGLLEEKANLENNIRILQQERAQIPSKNLVTTFRQSLDSMAGKLDEPESKANYIISSMNVKLRTNLSLQDNELQFQLPKPDDIIPPENLSTIEFTIRSTPKELDLSEYIEVPDLTGMTLEEAEYAITDAGFKPGTTSEKNSNSPQGMVIDQMPSACSLAIPGAAIDITVSKIIYVDMPNIVGLDIDSGEEVLINSQLEVGEITEQSSKSTSETILNQSIEAGTTTLIGTPVDIVIAARETVEVPGLIGKKLDMAKYLIRSAKLKPGNIIKQVSTEKADTVLEQDPLAGTAVLEGECVDIVISIIEALKVPDVTGKLINEARTILENKELRIGRIIKRTSTLGTGTVLDQNPKADTEVDAGIPLDLVVANQDIEMIEGIGPERGSKLKDIGINTIKDLAVADTETVGELVGKSTATKFISMAKLIDSASQLGSLGIDRQSAELLVKAAGI